MIHFIFEQIIRDFKSDVIMLGKRDPQRDIFETATQLDSSEINEMGIYGQMARYGSELFDDEDFAHLYDTDNGRPSTPPSMLAQARLLQHYENISERELVRRCKYDLRWKVALGLELETTDKPFARTTFQAFRYRLTLHGEEGMVFQKSIERAREAGLIEDDLEVALDTSPVRGRGAVQDTYQQISSQIGSVLRSVAKSEALDVESLAEDWELSRHIKADSIKGSECIDWDDSEQVDAFLAELIEEATRTVELADRYDAGGGEVELLGRIIDEDVEDRDDGSGPTVANQTVSERIVSTTDPQMRHGRKSNQQTYDGHKAHIGVDIESSMIVDIEVTKPSATEAEHIAEAIRRTERRTEASVDSVLGDSAYGTRKGHKQAEKVDVDLLTKTRSPNASWRLGADAFEVSDDGRDVTCPAGHSSERHYRQNNGWQHYFAKSDCKDCPLKEQCKKADRRTFLVPEDFHEKKRRRQWAKSHEGRQKLRQRVGVEHAIGRLKNLGAGQARYMGRDKTKAEWMWTAAVVNLSLIWNRRDAGAPEPTAPDYRPLSFQSRLRSDQSPHITPNRYQATVYSNRFNRLRHRPSQIRSMSRPMMGFKVGGLWPAL